MIGLKKDTGKQQIYVMNYDTYQVPESASGTGAGQERDRSGTNRKKINKINKTNTNVVPELRTLSKRLQDSLGRPFGL